ncbi:hypothetical protein [Ensifer sp. 22460]|uniref:hypothetical protein n=1 Tax=Ensifer sp. 22460 TaxID=3453922 RepID=UPI003F859F15
MNEFIRSPWAPLVAIALLHVIMTVVLSYRGQGKPFRFWHGTIMASGLTISLVIGTFVQPYVGLAVLGALIAWGGKVEFFGPPAHIEGTEYDPNVLVKIGLATMGFFLVLAAGSVIWEALA